MSGLFHVGHVAQLHEIQTARVNRGEDGIGMEVEELIVRLTSGGVAGKSDDPRVVSAKGWFDLGAGRELQILKFKDYLATIPEVPALPEAFVGRFGRLVLVEGRLSLTTLCRLARLKFNGNDSTFVPFDPAKAKSGVRWMWCQDGRRNRDRKPTDCRNSFPADEVGLDAVEGVSVYVDDPTVIHGHVLDLPGSVLADNRDDCAYLGNWDVGLRLDWYWDDSASPGCGSASRGELPA